MSILTDGFMPSGTMGINQNTLSDFSKLQYQSAGFNVGGNSAKLYLFSPQYMPYQVARPFVYQFTPDFIDTIKSQPSLPYAVGPQGRPSEAVMKAILPDAEGMVLNTTNIQNMWSFVLVVDSGSAIHGTITTPGIRKIAIGYVYDEPIDQFGNINPNATLMFTHSNTLMVKRSAGPTALPDGLTVYNNQDVDYANETTSMMYNEKVLLGTPREIMMFAQEQQANPTMTDYSSIDLGVVKQGSNDTRMIDNSIKAPRHQLSEIMTAIDNGINRTTDEEPMLNRFTNIDEMYTPPNERAIHTCIANMPSCEPILLSTGLDTTKPITLNTLNTMFPDIMVVPFKLKANGSFGWDASTQAAPNSNGTISPVMSIRNQLSFLASSCVQSVCSAQGIAEVAFSYMSKEGDEFTRQHQEYFQVHKFDLIIPRIDAVYELHVRKFKEYLDNELFSLIRCLAGEYEIHVIANMGGDILINLRLYNYPDPEDGTYFQTSARFGGMMNPMIGGVGTINNNVLQLAHATQSLVGNVFNANDFIGGVSMFGDQMMPAIN